MLPIAITSSSDCSWECITDYSLSDPDQVLKPGVGKVLNVVIIVRYFCHTPPQSLVLSPFRLQCSERTLSLHLSCNQNSASPHSTKQSLTPINHFSTPIKMMMWHEVSISISKRIIDNSFHSPKTSIPIHRTASKIT